MLPWFAKTAAKSQLLPVTCLALTLASCAHTTRHLTEAELAAAGGDLLEPPAPKKLTDILQEEIELTGELPKSSDKTTLSQASNGDLIVQGIKLRNTQFDIPINLNSRVDYWINYFCTRGRVYFTRYLERSEFFVPYIVPILKKNNLPGDLVYLAMIESGFNNLARSRARAVGPWQFIAETGRRYGLKVNWWSDDRRSIEKSTLAAAGYLGDLYRIFQSWELAAAAYNAGEAKLARAVRRFGTRDFWMISKQRFLRPETRDYVPKIMAAAIISKNRGQFGFPEVEPRAGRDEAVASDGEVVKVIKTEKPLGDLASVVRRAEDEAEDPLDPLSGELNGEARSDDLSAEIAGAAEVAAIAPQTDLPEGGVPAKPIQVPHVTKAGEVGGEELAEFEIQSPADLLKIATAAGLSYQTVKALNPEILRWCTPPTQKNYIVKLPISVKERFLATYNHVTFPRKVEFMSYKAQQGTTLHWIARHFGIQVDPLSQLNGLPAHAKLSSGRTILLPMPNDRTRTLASLEVRELDHPRRRSHKRRRGRSRRHVARVSAVRPSARPSES